MKMEMFRKQAIKKDKLLAFARNKAKKQRGFRANLEEEDRPKDTRDEIKPQKAKEFNFIYNGPPIKVKRGFEKLTQAQKSERELKSDENQYSRTDTYKPTEEPGENMMEKRLADVKEAGFKMKLLIEADHRFAKR